MKVHTIDYEAEFQVWKYIFIWCITNERKEKNLKIIYYRKTAYCIPNNFEDNWKIVLGALTCTKRNFQHVAKE